MNTENIRGRHRAPGRHNPLNELKLLARESAQPAMKAGAVVAATGGLVATFANPASADTLSPNSGDVAAAAGVDAAAPAAVGPATAATPAASTALSKIGYAPAAQQAVAHRVRQAQAAGHRGRPGQDRARCRQGRRPMPLPPRKAAAQRASRDLTRTTLTTSTSSAKSSATPPSPSASSGVRASSNWATAGQCTWGALNKWYQSEGYYPGGWTGNAMAWASGAAIRGLHRDAARRARGRSSSCSPASTAPRASATSPG